MKKSKITPITKQPSLWALSPLLVFLCLYLVVSLIVNDFYKVPITVAFLVSSVYAVCITSGLSLNDRIMQYSKGAADKNIMLMIWIFVLAGAFAQSAKDIGAIDATVNMALQLLPGNLLLAGFFLAACFISLSIGTSVGTIVALVPVIAGIAEKTGMNMSFMTAIVVGGAFFGDNLSFISDTTIAATRTQGCAMRDKFKVNFRLVLPAALVVLGYYIYRGYGMHVPQEVYTIEWVKVIPYLVVLATAFMGFNVAVVLLLGILASGIVGISTGTIDMFDWFGSLGTGMSGMGELIIITLMAGGMLELIRFNGGVDYIIHALTRKINGKTLYFIAYNQRFPFFLIQRGLARELGHIVLGHDGTRPEEIRMEEARVFAYHLLCPRPLIRAIQDTGIPITIETLGLITGCYERCLVGMQKSQ